MTRYALYYAPDQNSAWWTAGCRWLGRDPVTGQDLQQPAVDGIPPLVLQQLSSDARRYGFHATLKAPFRLAEGFHEEHLLHTLAAFCAVQTRITVPAPTVLPMGDFLALRTSEESRDINALAMRCVSFFDFLRAPPGDAELGKRRSNQLTQRQEQLLQRWGYPYTEEEYRFHLTLTDKLAGVDADIVYSLRKAAEAFFDLGAPLLINGIALFREDAPGAPFALVRRFDFGLHALQQHSPQLPATGRLFFVVGPSGSGKDDLLGWVRQNLATHRQMFFAERAVTRPARPSGEDESISPEQFWQQAAAGHFAMTWQSDDLCYGIRRGFEAELKAGRTVVVNGSREFVPKLLRAYPDAQVVWIEADHALIRQRMEERLRDNSAALLKRVQRNAQFSRPERPEVIQLDNTGSIGAAGQRLLDILGGS
ncbi:phosphonate metabolism protein/1,5-bisphosphokinase (PRPP-forming) PhnN [Undibacterium sp.]|jgi:phosphonate metabolism protein PhnN/1,5-bisphosphokinase (PRPP-forming)|uniref:phosphonate metabolism protein/1,5-bisphosphokinase (PRPP-forming) PhnN n=1 Tax=Undibacterium sp. TaxID=1914977 RepID=UPI002C6AA48A|nr:phosphonate metabolism protein/1,5-bisphosphokinase (PRPP-forming) PhnN [Undibacterium sp.]HTD04080.1 phosphonate metabolism protein/1,5-bisphosphokinase (PRPP-forming) PhnN [Undibacterium sp.]